MTRFLVGKTVLVTGGTKGIGRAIAAALLDAGANVGICGRNGSEVDRAVSELRNRAPGDTKVVGAVCDVSRPDEVLSLFEVVDKELSGLDVLVNNAGVGFFSATADLSIEQWQQTIDTNLSGAFYCSREASATLPRAGGRIYREHLQSGGEESVRRRCCVQRVEIRTQWIQRSDDAGSSAGERARDLHHAGQRGHVVREEQ